MKKYLRSQTSRGCVHRDALCHVVRATTGRRELLVVFPLLTSFPSPLPLARARSATLTFSAMMRLYSAGLVADIANRMALSFFTLDHARGPAASSIGVCVCKYCREGRGGGGGGGGDMQINYRHSIIAVGC